jgi:hypothetical protein
VLNDTGYSRDLRVLTAMADKLERGSAPVDTKQLIDELGLTRQDLTAGPARSGCGISDREVARADHVPPQRPFDSRGEDHLESS